MDVQVTNQPAPQPAEQLKAVSHPPGYDAACMTCHDESMTRQQHLTPAQWDREVNKMTVWERRSTPRIAK
jgi:hypothetical protein